MTDYRADPNSLNLLEPKQRTVPEILLRQARLFGDKPLLSMGSVQWTHHDAFLIASARAATLANSGVSKGDSVALMLGNRPEFLECFLACGWIGAVSVPINTAAMGPQIGYYIANSLARLAIIEAQYIDRLLSIDLGITNLREIWIIGNEQPLPKSSSVTFKNWPAAGASIPASKIDPGSPLAILYTSGTTGPAKGVVCSHAQYYWWGINSLYVLSIDQNDTLCTTLPLFHINALNTYVQAALAGCKVVFEERFSAAAFWSLMCERGATVIYVLGAMASILLAQQPNRNEREHRVRIGLGPGLPLVVGESFRARTGVLLLDGYGSTETNFAIATLPDSPRQGVMGWALPGFDVRVADDDDNEVPIGVAGELLLRVDYPYAFASGYFNMPDRTVEAWRNLWFHTGDRVVREADGALRFIDRIKDAIRRRGENISAFEVEQVLLGHPDVATVAVYAVRSELGDDDVMAALVARSGRTPDLGVLAAWCEERLPYFAIPRYFDLVQDLPRTENGKVQKYKLREQGITSTAWERKIQRRN
jgi:crotonobetaine/carnitine-CoA ligase